MWIIIVVPIGTLLDIYEVITVQASELTPFSLSIFWSIVFTILGINIYYWVNCYRLLKVNSERKLKNIVALKQKCTVVPKYPVVQKRADDRKWRAIDIFIDPPRYYEIEQDLAVGFYLYVYEHNRCMYDTLQDDLDMAMRCARDDFGVPMDAWKKVEE